MAKEININLGSGIDKRKGYLSVDRDSNVGADIVCDLNKVPWNFKTSSVDNIFSEQMLEHLWIELPDFVSEARRVLKPHGKIEIITHNNFLWKHRLAFLAGNFKQEQGWHVNHSFLLKPSELKRYFELNAFEVELKPVSRFWKLFEKIFPDLFSPYIHLVARKRP